MKLVHPSSICPKNCFIRSVFGASSIEGGPPLGQERTKEPAAIRGGVPSCIMHAPANAFLKG